MHTIFIKHRGKISRHRNVEGAISVPSSSSLVKLNPENCYSSSPCLKNCDKVIAYSKGKIATLPVLPWDKEKQS